MPWLLMLRNDFLSKTELVAALGLAASHGRQLHAAHDGDFCVLDAGRD
jgi:hypothetical protein